MYKRFNELSFIIGLFFFILSLILIINELLNTTIDASATLYSGIVFCIFGIIMMLIKSNDEE
jgi:membrane-bound ClpP family serine protease